MQGRGNTYLTRGGGGVGLFLYTLNRKSNHPPPPPLPGSEQCSKRADEYRIHRQTRQGRDTGAPKSPPDKAGQGHRGSQESPGPFKNLFDRDTDWPVCPLMQVDSEEHNICWLKSIRLIPPISPGNPKWLPRRSKMEQGRAGQGRAAQEPITRILGTFRFMQ